MLTHAATLCGTLLPQGNYVRAYTFGWWFTSGPGTT
jgi:hypothetical protein